MLPEALRRSTYPMRDYLVQAAMRATAIALGRDLRHGRQAVTCHTLRHLLGPPAWGRQLQHHPHVHIVILGVVLAPDGSEEELTG